MNLFRRGHHEPLKAGVHGGLLLFAAICAGYNLVAWAVRRAEGDDQIRHLAINVAIYGGFVGYEVVQVARHMERT